MIEQAIIPAAGFGTRLLPATKEQAKEMLPLFALGRNGELLLKPALQIIFEQLFVFGVTNFCFIVDIRRKKSVVDHFKPDREFLQTLKKDERDTSRGLESFYSKLDSSWIIFVSQTSAKGFGDAVLIAKKVCTINDINTPFFCCAGDTLILSPGNKHLKKLWKVHGEFNSDASFFVKQVKNPSLFGVIDGDEVEKGVYRVKKVIEKPVDVTNKLAITGLYIFTPSIFEALSSIPPGFGGEIQLTDAIQKLIDSGLKVMAVTLDKDEFWLDISTPETYWVALKRSRELLKDKVF